MTGNPIRFIIGADAIKPEQLAELYTTVGWRFDAAEGGPAGGEGPLDRLGRLIAGSSLVVTAWDGPALVGFGRCLTDGAFIGYVNNVAVRPQYWRRGIGRRLVEKLMGAYPGVLFMVSANAEIVPFFERLGFRGYQTTWMAHDPQGD
ncbi:MAG: GNAT family N-acetyltransferase [Bacillota bacterium]